MISKEEYEALGLSEFLKNPLTKKLRAEAKQLRKSDIQMREDFIREKFEQGGKPALERIKRWGRSDRGTELNFDPWFCELIEGLADFRFSERYTTGCSQMGKSQPLDSKILTPNGWLRMGDIKVGDLVIARDGTPTEVIGVYPQGEKSTYKVIMDDGSFTECCDEHLWYTQTAMDRGRKYAPLNAPTKSHGTRQRDWEPTEYGDRPGSVKTLREIMETLHQVDRNGNKKISRGKLRSNHSIPLCKPIQYKTKYYDVHPYLLGALIGDGCLRNDIGFSTKDKEILDRIYHLLPDGIEISSKGDDKDYGFVKPKGSYKNILKKYLAEIGIFGHKSNTKFIPEVYKFGDVHQRLDLLRGLMDTDGTCAKGGNVEFGSVSLKLVEDVRDLVCSLGGKTNLIRTKQPFYKKNGEKVYGQTYYRLSFKLNFNPFYLSRKYDLWKETSPETFRRYIRDVQYVGEKESQCIAVAHSDHLYITDDYIVTHNTASNILVFVDTLTFGRCATGYFFPSRSAMQNNQPVQYLSVLESYIANMAKDGITFNRERDRMQLERVQIQGVTATFSYASTGRDDPTTGLAAVGGAAASFTADICAIEERSQIPASAADPIPRRLDASVIPTKPLFILGTPGSGSGVEADIKARAHYEFYPAFECPHCGSIEFLDPKGCVLKEYLRMDASGNRVPAFLSESGRPHEWFHHDENDAVGTAYIACPNCHNEIDEEIRLSGRYRCKKNKIWFRDFVDQLPKGIPDKKINVAFHISPLLRRSKINLAEDIIKSGIEASSSIDWQQQKIGHPSEMTATALTMEILMRSLKAPVPERLPEVVLAGLDQGRSQHALAVSSFILPQNYKNMPTEEVIDKTIRQYLFLGEVVGSAVPDKLKQYNVTSAFCDADPERRVAAEWQRTTVMKMAQQISGLADNIKKSKVQEGGSDIDCFKIRNERFLSQVLLSFITLADDGFPLARLPKDLERWISTPVEASPIRQLQNVRLEPSTGKWIKNGADHSYHACLYLELCFYHFLTVGADSNYIPGALCTVENSVSSSYTPLGYGKPRGVRRSSFIPSRRF